MNSPISRAVRIELSPVMRMNILCWAWGLEGSGGGISGESG